MPVAISPTVTFSLTPDHVVENPATTVSFNFDLDVAPPEGEYVSVWLYASETENAPISEALHGGRYLADFDLMKLFQPGALEGINLFSYNYDVSVEAGVSHTGTFHVIEMRLTQQHNSMTMTGLDDNGGYDDAPRSYYWNVAADPNENPEVQIVNGSQFFTEYTTPDEMPAENAAPDAVADAATTDYETAVAINVLANDSDADGDELSIASVGAAANGTAEIVDGQIVYTPNDGFSGDDVFTYTAEDGNGGSDEASVTVTVGDNPTPPTPVVSMTADRTVLTEDGRDAITLTFNVENLPADGLRVGLAAYRDGESGQETFPYGIAQFAVLPYFDEGTGTVLYPTFNGIDNPGGWDMTDGLTFTITSETATATLPIWPDPNDLLPDAEGYFRTEDVGVDTMILRLVDFQNYAVSAPLGDYEISPTQGEVTVTLKDSADDSYEAADASAATNGRAVEIDVLALNPDAVEIVAVENRETSGDGLMQHGDAYLDDKGTADTSDDTIVYTPDEGFVGRDYLHFVVRNADGEIDQAQVKIDVAAFSNEAPVAVDDAVSTSYETPLVFDPTTNDTDADGDFLSVVSVGAAANGTVNFDGQIYYTPNAGFSGEDSFTYTVSDEYGEESTATVTVTVGEAPNTVPVAANDAVSTDYQSQTIIDVLANDTDADGDALTIASVGEAANGTVYVDDGLVFYTPNDGFSGEDSFSYTVSDGNGGESTATVTVTVGEAPNTAPVAANDAVSTEYQSQTIIDVLANDTDADGDWLTIASVGEAANGTVYVDDELVFYTPNDGFSGEDSFSYTVSDGNGGTSTATVTVTVGEAPNAAPVAANDAVSTDYQTAAVIDVLANDTDADGDALTIASVGDAANGAVEIVDGQVVYTPNDGFSGEDSFIYTVDDGNGGADTASVSVTVEGEGTPDPVIYGTAASDRMFAPAAGAILDGLEGRDVYFGRAGADTFVMGDLEYDQVRRFDASKDKLDISAWGVESFDELRIYDRVNEAQGSTLITIRHAESGNVAYHWERGDRLSSDDFSEDNFIFADNLIV